MSCDSFVNCLADEKRKQNKSWLTDRQSPFANSAQLQLQLQLLLKTRWLKMPRKPRLDPLVLLKTK